MQKRSTKASAAVERLNKRSGNLYSLSCRPDGLFALVLTTETGHLEPLGSPQPMDQFLLFVNGIDPPTPKRISKLDVAFRTQLENK